MSILNRAPQFSRPTLIAELPRPTSFALAFKVVLVDGLTSSLLTEIGIANVSAATAGSDFLLLVGHHDVQWVLVDEYLGHAACKQLKGAVSTESFCKVGRRAICIRLSSSRET